MKICKQKLLLVKDQSFEYNQQIRKAADVVDFMEKMLNIQNEAQEVIYLLTMNKKNQIIALVEIARRRNRFM